MATQFYMQLQIQFSEHAKWEILEKNFLIKIKNIKILDLLFCLKKLIDQIKLKNYFINNIDINIIAQKPKISKL